MSHRPSHQATPFTGIIPTDVKCSICSEDVVDDNQKGISKLQCGHFFHLACIGNVFNAIGAMVCPNCWEIEDSEWKYSHDDGDDMYHVMHQSLQATNDSLLGDQFMPVGGMFDPIPSYNMTFEVPAAIFDFGSGGRSNSPTPFVHSRDHRYAGLYISENGSIGLYGANYPLMSNVNIDLDSNGRLLQNSSGFGTSTGSPGAITYEQGGMSNPSNILPLLDLPSSSTPPNEGQGLHQIHSSSSASSAGPSPELGLNMSVNGGSLYGN